MAGTHVPEVGSYFLDPRGDGRALRVSWHDEEATGVVVLSLWRDNVCTGSFRLPVDDVPDLLALLGAGLARRAHRDPRDRPRGVDAAAG